MLAGVAMLLLATTGALNSCQKNDPEPPTTGGGGGSGNGTVPPAPTTPATSIPDALVGTWYVDTNSGPMTNNWDQGTFQGSQGFAEYRTMVLTKTGTGAVEYHSEVFNVGGEEQRRLYKMTGTLNCDASTTPARLTFQAQSGTMRIFSGSATGFQESPIVAADVAAYSVVWSKPEATTFTSAPNVLTANRLSGAVAVAVKYKQVPGTGMTNPAPGNGLYTTPPATGTYVKIGSQYYPTATIGGQVWMSVNYAGSGGISDSDHPTYGTYYRYLDLGSVQIPAGWRIPTRADYVALLASQGLALDRWNSTDPEDLPSKRKLGQLMAVGAWKKQDGYATNSSGFGAVPSDYRNTNGIGNGLGTNCRLWTSERDATDAPLGFQLFQLPTDTYASIIGYPLSTIPVYMPVRLVRDK